MKLKIRIDADFRIEDILFILFFCNSIIIGAFTIVSNADIASVVYVFLFIIVLILYLVNHSLNSIATPILLYLCVLLAFGITYLFHPEYQGWFTHKYYGVIPALVNPKSGIWAFLILWIMKDEKRILRDTGVVCWILFAVNTLRFIMAMRRGYWNVHDISGEVLQRAYNLEFGYDMLFSTSFMGAMAYLSRKKQYYIPFVMGVLMILMGGSRGAVIWPVIMFPLMLPFHWESLNKKQRVEFTLLFSVLIFFMVALMLNYQIIIQLLSSLGLKSRTIESLLAGSISDGSGRERIYGIAIDMIQHGGPFGWGVYGDRYALEKIVQWGYVHNIFLELLVSFGYLGGSFLLFLLIKGVAGLYKNCHTLERQIIFITFLTTSFKLMLSNSFWYTSAFWVLLALMIKWKVGKTVRFGLRENPTVFSYYKASR